MWLLAAFGVHFFFGGGVSHVGKSSVVALVFGFGMDSCQTSVIFNHCTKRGFLVFISCNVRVSGKRFTYRFRLYAGFLDRRRVRGGLPSLCSVSSFPPGEFRQGNGCLIVVSLS